MCGSMFETLRTMFDLSMGGVNKLFLHDFRGILFTYHLQCCFSLFLSVFSVF